MIYNINDSGCLLYQTLSNILSNMIVFSKTMNNIQKENV